MSARKGCKVRHGESTGLDSGVLKSDLENSESFDNELSTQNKSESDFFAIFGINLAKNGKNRSWTRFLDSTLDLPKNLGLI